MRCVLFMAVTLTLASDQANATSGLFRDSVRRLAPSVFRDLPINVRRDLESRGCLIPQPWGYRTPQNAIRGAFSRTNITEWAVLCSVRERSQILIYRRDSSRTTGIVVADSLERLPDEAWMQIITKGRSGYSRLIRTRARQRISGWRRDIDENTIPQPIDHDAIEQIFVEKAAQAFYFARGRWYRHTTAD
jgi:hypothetical protein